MTVKFYQEKAINSLVDNTIIHFENYIAPKTFVLKSPTGSGKTFIMAKYIESLLGNLPNEDLVFLWLSVGNGRLHEQSYNSVNSILKGYPRCLLAEDNFTGTSECINKSEVVFVNWESINNKSSVNVWTNNLMKDIEHDTLPKVLNTTRLRGAKIILIIDESHSTSKTERALEIRESIIKPSLTIEVSATPTLHDVDYKYTVASESVIQEQMMKKSILINADISKNSISDDDITSQEFIVSKAYEKRLELKKMLIEENSNVNPLVLIQIPDTTAGDMKIDFLTQYLGERKITVDNGKLAIWLSDTSASINKSDLRKNDSEVEYLIFKQAIAQGWDCPRAYILIRFREIKSFTFETQVVGRILRTAEQKFYNNEILNVGYAYTNLKSIIIAKKEENDKNILDCISIRKLNYKPLHLTSHYMQRLTYNDINNTVVDFKKILENHFILHLGLDQKYKYVYATNNEDALANGFDFFSYDLMDSIISENRVDVEQLDNKLLLENEERNFQIVFSEEDLQNEFDNIIKRNLNGLAFARSHSRIRTALNKCFSDYFNITLKGNGIVKIQMLVVKYNEVFDRILNDAVKEFIILDNEEITTKGLKINNEWEISPNKMYNSISHNEFYSPKSLYEPFYVPTIDKKENNLEIAFIKYLTSLDSVEWFWQNGHEHNEYNFGIDYGKNQVFRPDFIVKFNDNYIGIFDTKPIDYNFMDTKEKSEGLYRYIEGEKVKGKKIIGGIVVQDSNFRFRINSNSVYKDIIDSHSEWEYFDVINDEHK